MSAQSYNFKMALHSLRDAWRKNLLALGGLTIGVGAVVAMLALTLMVRREALSQFDRTGLEVIAIRKVTVPGVASRPAWMDLETVRHLIATQPVLEQVVPVMHQRGTIIARGRQWQSDVLGVTESFFDLNSLELAEGRGLSSFDRFEAYAVLGHEQAERMKNDEEGSLLGRKITVNGRVLAVVGVLKRARAIKLQQEDINEAVLMPATTFERVFVDSGIDVIYARHRTGAVTRDVAADAADYLQASVPGLSVQVTSAAEVVAEMQRQLRLFTLLLGAVGSIALVLGGAGIMNSLMLAVAERWQEIGLRRALGAMRGDIQTQFMLESLMLCGAGGAGGLLLGLSLTRVVAWQAGWSFFISPVTIVLAVGLVAVMGVVIGFFPAAQAARLDPAVAMNDET